MVRYVFFSLISAVVVAEAMYVGHMYAMWWPMWLWVACLATAYVMGDDIMYVLTGREDVGHEGTDVRDSGDV